MELISRICSEGWPLVAAALISLIALLNAHDRANGLKFRWQFYLGWLIVYALILVFLMFLTRLGRPI